jgi:hypothetical protein
MLPGRKGPDLMTGQSRAARLRDLAVVAVSAAVLALCVSGTGSAAAAEVPPGPAPAAAAATQHTGNSDRCAGYTDTSLAAGGAVTGGFFRAGGYRYVPPGGPGETIVCLRSVRMDVYYSGRGTRTWQVLVSGKLTASRTFTLTAGHYYWDFRIGRDYGQPGSICVQVTAAGKTAGRSCYYADYLA